MAGFIQQSKYLSVFVLSVSPLSFLPLTLTLTLNARNRWCTRAGAIDGKEEEKEAAADQD
jgi:hypothetical protein